MSKLKVSVVLKRVLPLALLLPFTSGCGFFTLAVSRAGLQYDPPRQVSPEGRVVVEAYTNTDRTRLSVKYALTKQPHAWLNLTAADLGKARPGAHCFVGIVGKEGDFPEHMLGKKAVRRRMASSPKWPLESMRKLELYRVKHGDPVKPGGNLGVQYRVHDVPEHLGENKPTNRVYFVLHDADRNKPTVVSFLLPAKRRRAMWARPLQILVPAAFAADIVTSPLQVVWILTHVAGV